MNYPLLWSVRAEDFLPTHGPVPAPFLGGWVPTDSLYEYDLDKAREELAQSEYPDGGFTVSVAFPKGDAHYQAAAEILQAELKKLNIELDIQAREWTTVFTQFQEWKKENDDDAVRDMHGLTLGLPALAVDVSNYVGIYHSDSDINFCAYSNPDVDALLDEAETTTDMDHRDGLYKEAVGLILQDSPDIYLGLDTMIEVVGADIEGFQIPIIWHPWGVDIDKLSRSQ
jgi:peptide/nickel transport system substrate-binding protein